MNKRIKPTAIRDYRENSVKKLGSTKKIRALRKNDLSDDDSTEYIVPIYKDKAQLYKEHAKSGQEMLNIKDLSDIIQNKKQKYIIIKKSGKGAEATKEKDSGKAAGHGASAAKH